MPVKHDAWEKISKIKRFCKCILRGFVGHTVVPKLLSKRLPHSIFRLVIGIFEQENLILYITSIIFGNFSALLASK